MKFLTQLEKLLKEDERFLAEDGQILKSKVYDAAMDMDQNLLGLLISNDTMKNIFFKDVNGTLVFDKVKFSWIVESKEFLPNSYTMYKNKIGLADNKGDLISKKGDVALVWPYKDCVLKGGQDKEEQKRDEIFYNETLAPDEVRRLLYPKVFTNSKRYTESGVEKITEFDERENLIIKGNNLLALSSLLKRYEGKVKCVYIDPPYNPDSAANTFSYNNKFNHSTWLTFMKNRAEIAIRLLKDDGIFCCAIDHNELFYVGALFDEIFGRHNRLGIISVETNPGGRSDSTFFATSSEYFIVYAKDHERASINGIRKDKSKLSVYNKEDEISKYKLVPLRRTGSNSTPDKRPNLCYPIYYNTLNGSIDVKKPEDLDNWIEIMPMGTDVMRVWRWSKSKLMSSLADIEINESNGKYNVYVKDRIKETEKAKTMWYGSKYDASANGTKVLQKLNLPGDFSYPKSVYLMKDIIEILTVEEDIILDFHLGSGTTAAVAHKMNRQYIGIEQMDYIDTVTVPRLQKVIEGEQGGISKDVDWQGGGSFVYCELKELNQAFISQIEEARTSNEVLSVLKSATKRGFLIPHVVQEDYYSNIEEFTRLSLEEQKQFVMEILDKNKLYVNYCDINDVDMHVTPEERSFTHSFYGNIRKEEI